MCLDSARGKEGWVSGVGFGYGVGFELGRWVRGGSAFMVWNGGFWYCEAGNRTSLNEKLTILLTFRACGFWMVQRRNWANGAGAEGAAAPPERGRWSLMWNTAGCNSTQGIGSWPQEYQTIVDQELQ